MTDVFLFMKDENDSVLASIDNLEVTSRPLELSGLQDASRSILNRALEFSSIVGEETDVFGAAAGDGRFCECWLRGAFYCESVQSIQLRFVVWCPIESGVLLRPLASESGKTASAYVAEMIRERVSGLKLSESDRSWGSDRLKTNCHRRTKADAKTAVGYYRGKRKRLGRPRKPRPKKI